MLRLKVEVMHAAGKMFRSFKSALHKRLVDDHLGSDVRQLTSLPGFHLLAHGLKVSLHSINTDRDAVDEGKRFRVFGEHRGKHTRDNIAKFKLSTRCYM